MTETLNTAFFTPQYFLSEPKAFYDFVRFQPVNSLNTALRGTNTFSFHLSYPRPPSLAVPVPPLAA
jgi:hypothetical protein